MASTARQSFEAANAVVDAETEWLFSHDAAAYQALLKKAPWREDPYYFQHVRISVVALLKMVLHARAGGDMEVMGLMQGRVCCETRTMYVTDAFALPVEGTETRVNAQDEAYEYMVSYLDGCRATGRPQHALGWYHSHPGYGCWLSGIDVQTQQTNQQQDPFVAVVIDPWRTMTAGHVDIGAFRTLPAEHHVDAPSARPPVPADKAEDYGAHASRYYPLDVRFFKLASDRAVYERLWSQYWAHALHTSPSRLERAMAVQATHDLARQLGTHATAVHGAPPPTGVSLVQAARAAPRAADADSDATGLAQHLAQREHELPLARLAAASYERAADAEHAALRAALHDSLWPTREADDAARDVAIQE